MSTSSFFWKLFWTAVVLGITVALVQGMMGQDSPERFQLAVVLMVITATGAVSLLTAIIAQIWEA
jgi:hypothetical protein